MHTDEHLDPQEQQPKQELGNVDTPSHSHEEINAPAPMQGSFIQTNPEIQQVQEMIRAVKAELQKVIVGQNELIDLLLTALLSNGHVLLEGVPGIAKTLTINLLASALDTGFKRIQFTPDLMPSDVVGTTVFNMKTSEFSFRKGPVFSNLILIDEINRAPAKTQAALFEIMEEKQVTVDGQTYPIEFPLFIAATQNPIEQEGTYKLPEAQLDRFLFRIKINYPGVDDEFSILQRFRTGNAKDLSQSVQKALNPANLKKCMDIIDKVHIKDELLKYIAQIVDLTRNSGDLFLGASPRASLAIMNASKAMAAIMGRDFVIPDDIQYVAYPVLNHRIILTPEREMEGLEPEDIISQIIKKVEVPR